MHVISVIHVILCDKIKKTIIIGALYSGVDIEQNGYAARRNVQAIARGSC